MQASRNASLHLPATRRRVDLATRGGRIGKLLFALVSVQRAQPYFQENMRFVGARTVAWISSTDQCTSSLPLRSMSNARSVYRAGSLSPDIGWARAMRSGSLRIRVGTLKMRELFAWANAPKARAVGVGQVFVAASSTLMRTPSTPRRMGVMAPSAAWRIMFARHIRSRPSAGRE